MKVRAIMIRTSINGTTASATITAKEFPGTPTTWSRTPVPTDAWIRTLTGAKTILVVKGRERAFPKNEMMIK